MADNKTNSNLTAYQEKQREEMCNSINDAIMRLRELGLRVTKRAIADEVGCHENTLRLPYVQAFLSNYEEFQPKQQTSAANLTLDEALNRISRLEESLEHSRNQNKALKTDNARLRKERDDWKDKYERLLGRFQIEIGKMKVNF